MSIENPRNEKYKAEMWRNKPEFLAQIEKGRYPHERALRKIISGAFKKYVQPGSSIFEVGAGLGYLKTLVPAEYHGSYVSSDYSLGNLRAGQEKRELKIQQASAYRLPVSKESQDCVVNMDAYDTLANLGKAMEEVKRVLKPDGTYIHFQVNLPSDDTVQEEHRDLIFFPPRYDQRHSGTQLVGMTRKEFEKGIATIETPDVVKGLKYYLADPEKAYARMEAFSNNTKVINALHVFLDAMPFEKITIPSLQAYFQSKMERKTTEAGLRVIESKFRGTTFIGKRSASQMHYPDYNQFSLEQGFSYVTKNSELKNRGSKDVIESASILVFVAKK